MADRKLDAARLCQEHHHDHVVEDRAVGTHGEAHGEGEVRDARLDANLFDGRAEDGWERDGRARGGDSDDCLLGQFTDQQRWVEAGAHPHDKNEKCQQNDHAEQRGSQIEQRRGDDAEANGSGEIRQQREHADGSDAHDNLDDPKNDLLSLVKKIDQKTVTGARHVLVESNAAQQREDNDGDH